MADDVSGGTMTEGALRWCERQGSATRAEVRSMAAELLAAREQLRLADALAREIDAYLCAACNAQSEHAPDCPLAAYIAARSAR